MRGRAGILVAGAAAVLLVLGGVWWLTAQRRAASGDGVAADTAAASAEHERVRAEIEAQRTAEAQGRDASPPDARARLLSRDFSHTRHRELPCTQCHDVSESHGAVTVTDARQCRDCHHTEPLAANCARCHTASDFAGERRTVVQTFSTSVATSATRDLVFTHAQHGGVQCTACHQAPGSLAVVPGCADCHQEHHQPNLQCMACHTAPPRAAHTVQAHLGCTAAGCHDPAPVTGVPRTRNFCLVCHQDQIDHERGGNCADCHRLPPPRAAAAPVPMPAVGR
jgi:hypothetical protein